MRWIIVAVGVLILGASLGLAAMRVVELEDSELDHSSPLQRLEQGADQLELSRVALRQGALATFEVCALDSLAPERWAGTVNLVVRHVPSGREEIVMPLEEGVLAYATRTERAACLLLAFDEPTQRGGEHAVVIDWSGQLPEEIIGVPFLARVLARGELTSADSWLVVLVMLGALLGAGGLVRWHRMPEESLPVEPTTSSQAGRSLLRVLVALASLGTIALAASLLPLGGATAGLIQGIALAMAQVALALGLAHGRSWFAEGRPWALGLVRPSRAFWLLALASPTGAGLWFLGGSLRALVPSTSVAPIETAVSSPSGMLSIAVVAALVPLAEELFFRGLLFGLLERRWNGGVSFFATSIIFTLAHLWQAWGAWGSVVAILATGLTLTGLRWWSGSVTAPAIAHMTHNGIVVYFSLAAAVS